MSDAAALSLHEVGGGGVCKELPQVAHAGKTAWKPSKNLE